ncbi:MAG TPA: hypothetical protein VLN08_03035, partial [Vicinamibacterales bacterium]|nr:hypothetical protein [Vicinamibacterales bacterium]
LTAIVRQRSAASAGESPSAASAVRSGRLILLGAFMSSIAIGFRSQAAWLTLPVLALAILDRAGRGAAGALIGSLVWLTAGTLLWFVPLVIASGGPGAYYAAFSAQAGEDWSGVDLVATGFTSRELAFALYDTLVRHWAGAGWLIAVLAAIGAAVLLWRGRRALMVIIIAFVPYAMFHLLFQETVTTRYALPLVPAAAYLAVRGLYAPAPIGGLTLAAALAIVLGITTAPVTATYARAGGPVVRALADLRTEAEEGTAGVAVGMHHPFARLVEAEGVGRATALAAPPKHEWLELVKQWQAGARGPVWFLADPRRTDLALVDPRAQTVRAEYEWPIPSQVFLGGIRPNGLRWIVISEPGWFAGEGWHLTPETAGVARADGAGLGKGPIRAWIRSRAGAATLMIGGRHLGSGSGTEAVVSVRIDGRDVESWTATPSAPSFLRLISLAEGALACAAPWCVLEVRATAPGGAATGVVAIDQFDLQEAAMPLLGFADGWQEPEYDPALGQSWRWATGKATLRVSSWDRDVEVHIVGESPRRYFDRPSRVVAAAGDTRLSSLDAGSDFTWSFRVPAAALAASGGAITIETDQVFRPADRGQGADQRELGLRVYKVTLTPAS